MSNKEILSLLKRIRPILEKAFNHDEDVFGMLHNDAVDVSCEIENTITKLEKGE